MPIGGRGVTWQSVDMPIMAFAEQNAKTTLVYRGGATGSLAPYAWEMDANECVILAVGSRSRETMRRAG